MRLARIEILTSLKPLATSLKSRLAFWDLLTELRLEGRRDSIPIARSYSRFLPQALIALDA